MSTTTKFTQGPWVATERSGYQEILAHDAECDWYGCKNMHAVAYVDTEVSEQQAHAHLIAAAPELYEAAAEAEQLFRDLTGKVDEAFLDRFAAVHFKARTALAKACGEVVA